MDLELVKFINSDLTWKTVKKGRRSVSRRSRRTESSSSEFGFQSGNKSHASVSDYEKSGVAILGQHFAEEILDVPIKKRILLLQSPAEGARPPQPQTPSPHHEPAKGSAQASVDLNDFSGIELLAAAACHSSGQLESFAVEEYSTPGVKSYPEVIQQDVSPMDSSVSSVQDNTPPVTQSVSDDVNDDSEKTPVPSKIARLHWDLNTLMEEWEEPCDICVDPHTKNSDSKDVSNDGLQSESRKSQVTEGVVDSLVNPAMCENVTTSTASISLEETSIKVESDEQTVSEVVKGGCLSIKGDTVDKHISLDHLSDCCGSNVSEDKVKSGYDSPVEDGELREPAVHTWEKEESEEMECVDYESDNMYEDNSDAIESATNELVDDHPETVKASVSVQNNDLEQGDKAYASFSKHSQPVTIVEKDSISKTFQPERKNMPCIERPTSTSFIRCSRSERDFDQEKFMGREGPSHHRGQLVDSFSRNKHESDGYLRPKYLRSGGSSNIGNNEAINYNPRGIYRNDSYGIHGGAPPSRDISRDRSRVGLKTPQGEYNNRDPYYSERKAPFLASNYNRGGDNPSRSQKQSRSRSRSGSPIAWHFQKKRNVDTKRQSPEYKPDTRFPVRRPSEIEAGLVSQTTGRIIRRFDERNVISGQYRERRSSPVRTTPHRERHDPPGYLGKLKPDGHFGPRFPHNSDYNSVRDDKYGMMNERRRFRYDDESCKGYSRNEDNNGFRYTRTENKGFRDPKYTSEEKGCRYTTNKMFNTGERRFHKDN